MSNLDRAPVPSVCGGRGFVVAEPVRELLSPRQVKLGESTEVRRLLPTIRPKELGLMTSGRAISHSEESPRPHARYLHGAQLWVALPDAHRHTDPHFEHHADLPTVTAPGLTATVLLGDLDGSTSPGT